MEDRHVNALRRIHQADLILAEDHREPSDFHLIHRGGMQREIHHPGWNPSWAVPDEHTIDDLEELGILRVEPHHDKARTFSLTMRGRQEVSAFAEQQARPTPTGGRAPSALSVLRWLVALADDQPACFDIPERILDRAVADGMIDMAGREPLAQRILGLIEQGYLRGEMPHLALATAEQRFARTMRLEVTAAAEKTVEAGSAAGAAITIVGSMINSQIAAGDITSYVTFGDVLDRALAEVDRLDDVDPDAKAEARGLLERLRSKAVTATGEVMTGAGGAIAASVIARLLGLPHG